MKLFNAHEQYLRPIWEGGEIINESILPLYKKGESGAITIDLANPIKRIISVRTATLEREFTEDVDFLVENGRLVIPSGSAIKVMSWDEYNPSEGVFNCVTGGKLLFGEANFYHSVQYAVSYEPDGNLFEGKYFPTEAPELAGARAILDAGERELKLSFYGDSITYGCNASGLGEGLAPYMPVFPLLAAEGLRRRGYKVNYYNPSIGGMSTPWGRDWAHFYFDKYAPDVNVIAFGMNDGTGRRSVEEFIANTKSIIDSIRQSNPSCEFILVSPTLPNPLSTFVGLQADYEAPLAELAKAEGCAYLDMTSLHSTLLSHKEYHHMTGNNINHPSDFLARVYACGVLALLGR